MGMYTAFHFASEFKKDTPKEVIDVLGYMAGLDVEKPTELPQHPFFECGRWSFLFTMDSYYHNAKTHCDFSCDDISNSWYLTVTSNLKNYSNEIEHFVDWVQPYLEKHKGDFLGYSRYEETENPTIIKALISNKE